MNIFVASKHSEALFSLSQTKRLRPTLVRWIVRPVAASPAAGCPFPPLIATLSRTQAESLCVQASPNLKHSSVQATLKPPDPPTGNPGVTARRRRPKIPHQVFLTVCCGCPAVGACATTRRHLVSAAVECHCCPHLVGTCCCCCQWRASSIAAAATAERLPCEGPALVAKGGRRPSRCNWMALIFPVPISLLMWLLPPRKALAGS